MPLSLFFRLGVVASVVGCPPRGGSAGSGSLQARHRQANHRVPLTTTVRNFHRQSDGGRSRRIATGIATLDPLEHRTTIDIARGDLMSNNVADNEAVRLVERLREATNDHDPGGVAACFTLDYRSEAPAHPARSFTGRDQVRRNQEKIFAFVPDLTVDLLRITVDGNTIWTEWEHRGTRMDGSSHHMRGAIIF